MIPQNHEIKSRRIRKDFEALRNSEPGRFKDRLALSWSNWGFGLESLDASAARPGRRMNKRSRP